MIHVAHKMEVGTDSVVRKKYENSPPLVSKPVTGRKFEPSS